MHCLKNTQSQSSFLDQILSDEARHQPMPSSSSLNTEFALEISEEDSETEFQVVPVLREENPAIED